MKNVVQEMNSYGFIGRDELLNNYNEAKKNDVFLEMVSKLNLPESKLVKYTCSLEECSLNYYTCSKCKGLVNCPFKPMGYSYLPRVIDERLEFDYQPCRYKVKDIKNNSYRDNIFSFSIPADLKDASMDSIYSNDSNRYEAILWINTFLGNYRKGKNCRGLYLYGNFGCGKTYLISALFNELAHDGVKSAIVFWPEFLRDLKASFSSDFKEKYEYIKNIPLLLIDDIGAEATTSWSRDEIFCPLVQYRMQEKLPTFFTSNLDIKSLEDHFSVAKDKVDHIKARRIIERVLQLTDQVSMVSKNLRG
jgi:primosomal protein DnaI